MADDFVREKIIQAHPLVNVVQKYGVELKRGSNKDELVGLCPFHKENTPSFTVTISKQAFWCFGCQKGGSVIDFMAMTQNRSTEDVFKELANGVDPKAPLPPPSSTTSKEVAVYPYHDEHGNLVCEVIRYEPKTFRQRHPDGKGGWVWNMDGVRRVLYNLQTLMKVKDVPGLVVSILEGEKDVETMKKLGFAATCNIGGAGKWMDAYNEYFKGKSVVIWKDNDEPGRKHAEQVLESLANIAREVRICSAPTPFKDITEYVDSLNEEDPEVLATKVYKLIEDVPVLTGGIVLPIQSMNEAEITYSKFTQESKTSAIDLSKWLPTLGMYVRSIVPGEVIAVLAATGVGKTLLAQGLSISQAPSPVLMCELELPDTLTFERFVAMGAKIPSRQVFNSYMAGQSVDWRKNGNLGHIYICCDARLTPDKLRNYIIKSELKIGQRPVLVVVDYMQLFRGRGSSRYERVSDAAEEVKIIAKETNTVICVTSQIQRKKEDDNKEVGLNDGKESGSIENSSGLVLGAWREEEGSDVIWVKILKNTKGKPGVKIRCRVDGETLVVKEAPFDHNDVPA